jgi:hypothetical protein
VGRRGDLLPRPAADDHVDADRRRPRTQALADDFSSAKYSTQALRAINDAIADVLRSARIPVREQIAAVAVSAGTRTYALPANTLRVLAVEDASGGLLEQLDATWIDARGSDRGAPAGYALFGGTLTLYPLPLGRHDADRAHPADPVRPRYGRRGRSPPTGIPDSYQDMLVAFARSRLFRFEDDAEMSAFWRAEYERDLRRLRGDMGMRARRGGARVPGMMRCAVARSWCRTSRAA